MEQSNIYEAPQTELEVDISEEEFQLAPQGKRFLTLILDTVFYLIYSVMFGAILGVILAMTDSMQVLETISQPIPNFLFGLFLVTSYYFPQEILLGKTVGKMILGTKVVDLEGNKPKAGTILLRTFCRFIPFESFSFLYADGTKGWHDRLSKTKVVLTR
ncbi:RDD family protein [Lentisphaera marina]|uniref:RDD family protein n=1 Tax=Lentisphaera marina TaxID=1111041 RepID=UPI002366E341|nr:RDD family protein [Lentisphaera marina]MDD7985793.1 RDD family protein [Lentisphaera marina]